MIDTDKYEGHTEGPWNAEEEEVEEGKAWTVRGGDHWVVMESDGCLRIDWKKEDALLTADAPLLLAEVIRLREDNKKLHDAINGCAYANMQGSAHDLYCESMVERCPTCDENVESGLCNEECDEQ